MLINKTLLFDFDGTLVDSMGVWADGMLHLLQAEGVGYSCDVIEKLTPLGDEEMGIYLKGLGVRGTVKEIVAKIDAFAYALYENTIMEKEGVRETIVELHNKGYSLNILTAASHKMIDMCLTRLNMISFFDNIWSTDDLHMVKSNSKIYAEVAGKLGVEVDKITHFDDNITALKAAKLAGMKTVGVYDDTFFELEADIRKVADMYIFKFPEIFNF